MELYQRMPPSLAKDANFNFFFHNIPQHVVSPEYFKLPGYIPGAPLCTSHRAASLYTEYNYVPAQFLDHEFLDLQHSIRTGDFGYRSALSHEKAKNANTDVSPEFVSVKLCFKDLPPFPDGYGDSLD